MTQHDKLLITFPSKHDIFKGYVYTAVSRLTKLEDLFALNFNFTNWTIRVLVGGIVSSFFLWADSWNELGDASSPDPNSNST